MGREDLDRFDDTDHDLSEEVRDVATRVGPWLVSLGLHLLVVIMAILLVWTTITHTEDRASVDYTLQPAPAKIPALEFDTNKKLDKPKDRRRVNTRPDRLTRVREEEFGKVLDPIGPGPSHPKPFPRKPDTGSEEGHLFNARRGPGGGADGEGGGPTGPPAKSIVYVIDASGSLFDTFPYVTRELISAVGWRLAPHQKFSIIFFRDGEVVEVPVCKGMCYATKANVRAAINWVAPESGKITPRGRTEPDKALLKAFGYEPELIYLLSDNITGSMDKGLDPDQLVKFIDEHNRSNARINTIQFIYPDPRTKLGLKPTLQMVAEQTSGVYVMIPESRLQAP